MAKTLVVFVVIACLLLSLGCSSGPWRMSKSWQDRTASWYSENAWVHGALLQDILPVYPIVNLVLVVGDWLFVNTWYFWSSDAWSNKGTVHVHDVPTGPNQKPGYWTDGSSGVSK